MREDEKKHGMLIMHLIVTSLGK